MMNGTCIRNRCSWSAVGGMALSLAICLGGCNLLLPIAFIGNPREKVPAEFDKLPNSRTAVLIWAEPETLFYYPHVRIELSTHIRGQLLANLNHKDSQLEVIDPADVENLIQRKRSLAADPQALGKELNCDYVIFIELLRFQIRDPSSPELLHAKLDAAVTVHAIGDDDKLSQRYPLAPVKTEHPKRGPVLLSPSNPLILRRQAYEIFADQVA